MNQFLSSVPRRFNYKYPVIVNTNSLAAINSNTLLMTEDKFDGCILGGIIGDAWGSSYENENLKKDLSTFFLAKKSDKTRSWFITDDTQLTLATCEALTEESYSPTILAYYLLKYYESNKIWGIGSSTLKAILELQAGQHWSQSGRKGEYAAGNGAAMRIAPFAFFNNITKKDISDASRITHDNDEAYVGALSVYYSIKYILERPNSDTKEIFESIIKILPDTSVRDRFIQIKELSPNASISEVSKLGNNGYVVNSVPFAIYCATKVQSIGLTNMLQQIIETGGDTDTNASIAGQVAGASIGKNNIPEDLLLKVKQLREYDWIEAILKQVKSKLF